jgi:hypothetical protein
MDLSVPCLPANEPPPQGPNRPLGGQPYELKVVDPGARFPRGARVSRSDTVSGGVGQDIVARLDRAIGSPRPLRERPGTVRSNRISKVGGRPIPSSCRPHPTIGTCYGLAPHRLVAALAHRLMAGPARPVGRRDRPRAVGPFSYLAGPCPVGSGRGGRASAWRSSCARERRVFDPIPSDHPRAQERQRGADGSYGG